jgi:hypothetical protein
MTLVACEEGDVPLPESTSTGGSTNEPNPEPSETLACEPIAVCVAAFAEGTQPCPTCLVDDFEDKDGLILETDGRIGPWYGYVNAGYIEPVGSPISPAKLPELRGKSAYAMHVSGDNQGLTLLGVDLSRDGDLYGTYDASSYKGITFWVKNVSSRDLELAVLVATSETTNENYGGVCDSGCDPAFAEITLRGEAWTPVTLPWSALSGGSSAFHPDALTHVQLAVGQGEFDFWVDDFSFY